MINIDNMIKTDKKYDNIQVFVYCSRKCGSMSLTKTLNQYFNAFHVHNQKDFEDFYGEHKYTIFDVIDYNAKINKNIYIIDVYRTPIERKISSFFQSIDEHFPYYKRYNTKTLIKYFNCGYIYSLEEYQSIDEIMKYYDVPLFTHFDFEKGYNIVTKNNIHFIKLRFNDIKRWDSILSDIFNMNIRVAPDNISAFKEYSSAYKSFKKYYYIPNDYYHDILPNDINFRIYNTEEEQKNYIEKWKERLLT